LTQQFNTTDLLQRVLNYAEAETYLRVIGSESFEKDGSPRLTLHMNAKHLQVACQLGLAKDRRHYATIQNNYAFSHGAPQLDTYMFHFFLAFPISTPYSFPDKVSLMLNGGSEVHQQTHQTPIT